MKELFLSEIAPAIHNATGLHKHPSGYSYRCLRDDHQTQTRKEQIIMWARSINFRKKISAIRTLDNGSLLLLFLLLLFVFCFVLYFPFVVYCFVFSFWLFFLLFLIYLSFWFLFVWIIGWACSVPMKCKSKRWRLW